MWEIFRFESRTRLRKDKTRCRSPTAGRPPNGGRSFPWISIIDPDPNPPAATAGHQNTRTRLATQMALAFLSLWMLPEWRSVDPQGYMWGPTVRSL